MTMVLEAPPAQFIISADEDLYLDNTPISAEDFRRISAYVEKSKADFRRRERIAAQKTRKAVYTEGV